MTDPLGRPSRAEARGPAFAFPVRRLLALSLLWNAPRPAAATGVAAEAIAPLAEFVARVPALKQAAVLQLQSTQGLLYPMPLAATALTIAAAPAPAAAPAAALDAEAALLVSALAAQPDAPALHAVLGTENAPALRALSSGFARETAENPGSRAARRIQELRRRWDLGSADGARRLADVISARLTAAFDGALPSGPLASAVAATPRPRYDKLSGALAYYMTARGYARGLEALEYARGFHRGRRRDGLTPEFQHQVEIALHLTTLKDLPDEEQTLIVALLHDVVEDYDVAPEEIARRFGPDVSRRVWLLTKVYRGEKKDPDAYFDAIARDPIASLVKGADRVHNLQSMVGVFSLDKQREYADEAEFRFLPMLKDAERRFPQHGAAYRSLRHMLKSQLALIRASLAAAERP